MRYQVGASNGKYVVICLTTGAVVHSCFRYEEADKKAYELENIMRNKAERELLAAAGCYPAWCGDDD